MKMIEQKRKRLPTQNLMKVVANIEQKPVRLLLKGVIFYNHEQTFFFHEQTFNTPSLYLGRRASKKIFAFNAVRTFLA